MHFRATWVKVCLKAQIRKGQVVYQWCFVLSYILFCFTDHVQKFKEMDINSYNKYKWNKIKINEIIITINTSHGDKVQGEEMCLRRNLITVKKVKFFCNCGAAAEKAQQPLSIYFCSRQDQLITNLSDRVLEHFCSSSKRQSGVRS